MRYGGGTGEMLIMSAGDREIHDECADKLLEGFGRIYPDRMQ